MKHNGRTFLMHPDALLRLTVKCEVCGGTGFAPATAHCTSPGCGQYYPGAVDFRKPSLACNHATSFLKVDEAKQCGRCDGDTAYTLDVDVATFAKAIQYTLDNSS